MEKKEMKKINKIAGKIIEDVTAKGDAAVRYCTKKFDNSEFLPAKQHTLRTH